MPHVRLSVRGPNKMAKPTAAFAISTDAAAINSRGSSIRKARNTSSAVGCIFGYGNQWEKQTGGMTKRRKCALSSRRLFRRHLSNLGHDTVEDRYMFTRSESAYA